MTGKKVLIDTAPFIYVLEKGDEVWRSLFWEIMSSGDKIMISSVTLSEYCTGCYKHGREDIADSFVEFIDALRIEVIPVSRDIAMEAAKIRGEYQGFKMMDSILIATAVVTGAERFYTNDEQLFGYRGGSLKIVGA